MTRVEHFSHEYSEISDWGNRFPIKFYINPDGYLYKEKRVECRTCGNTATRRLEVYNHIHEPQGSFYYCESCVPKPNLAE